MWRTCCFTVLFVYFRCFHPGGLGCRPVTSLGQEGRRVFWEGSKSFELCPIVLNHVQDIFPGERKIFYVVFATSAPHLVTGLLGWLEANSSPPLVIITSHVTASVLRALRIYSTKLVREQLLDSFNTRPLDSTNRLYYEPGVRPDRISALLWVTPKRYIKNKCFIVSVAFTHRLRFFVHQIEALVPFKDVTRALILSSHKPPVLLQRGYTKLL